MRPVDAWQPTARLDFSVNYGCRGCVAGKPAGWHGMCTSSIPFEDGPAGCRLQPFGSSDNRDGFERKEVAVTNTSNTADRKR
jgi:hypothetical protein